MGTASVDFLPFSKLHCTRNYIHANLFASFVLKAAAVLATDRLLQTRYGQQLGDDLSVSLWLSDGVSPGSGDGVGSGSGLAIPVTLCLLRRWPAAGWPRSSCSTVLWPTTAGCWWRASTCTACWACSPSPRGAASPSTWASAGVRASTGRERAWGVWAGDLSHCPRRCPPAVCHPLGGGQVPLRKCPVSGAGLGRAAGGLGLRVWERGVG